MAYLDITGEKYGRLTAICHAGKNASGRHAFQFKCDCGNEFVAVTAEVRMGRVKSCGCLQRELSSKRLAQRMTRHGFTKDPSLKSEYSAWKSMKKRCSLESHPQYKDWGGRGISVCDKWNGSFEAFLEDVGRKPSPELTLDRIDNNGNYEPGNVRWATRYVQTHNRRNSIGGEL